MKAIIKNLPKDAKEWIIVSIQNDGTLVYFSSEKSAEIAVSALVWYEGETLAIMHKSAVKGE